METRVQFSVIGTVFNQGGCGIACENRAHQVSILLGSPLGTESRITSDEMLDIFSVAAASFGIYDSQSTFHMIHRQQN